MDWKCCIEKHFNICSTKCIGAFAKGIYFLAEHSLFLVILVTFWKLFSIYCMRQMEFCFLWNIYWEWKSFFSSLVAFCCRNCLWLGNLAGVTLSTWSFWPNLMADLTGTDPRVILLFQKLNIGVFLLHQQVSGNIITFLFITFAVSWRAWCWDPAVLSSGWAIQQMLQERLSFFYTRCMPGFKKLKYQGV